MRFAFRPNHHTAAQPVAPQASTASVPIPQIASGHASSGTLAVFGSLGNARGDRDKGSDSPRSIRISVTAGLRTG